MQVKEGDMTIPGAVCEHSGTRVHVIDADDKCEFCGKELLLVASDDMPAHADTQPTSEDLTWLKVLGCELRIWEPDPQQGDLGRMYVLEALGVSLLVREREDGTFVHVEDEGAVRAPLLVEVNNGGENVYGEEPIT